ncbi:hypothetical protein GE09DRAFT_363721 [Coniochaeta sp. 2T2.1]|nr:hypothetical protein GE09DRAFT_363721 [Coniochaeta sp. 2T2.1]
MGGLVVKQAYLLATRDPIYKGIARRIRALYFLGTPHRGADAARFARLVRHPAVHGSKAFVEDLLPGSGALDRINDEFRHHCSQLQLWSFFEGAETNFGPMSSIVVNKESAVLGLPGEHVQYLGANHRQMCKFSSPTDPNYLILRRCFRTTIHELEADFASEQKKYNRSEMNSISSFLRIVQRPNSTLLATNQKQHHGSCRWLTADDTFQEWLGGWEYSDGLAGSSPVTFPRIFWLKGRPGTGKSVAAGHVITYLEACNIDCSFFFFRHDDQAQSTVSALLRSLAYQMADALPEIRRCITSMIQDEVNMEAADQHILWRAAFLDRILRVELRTPHFWVIDAVDECRSQDLQAFVSILTVLSRQTPNRSVRVFITSRPGGELQRLLMLEQTPYSELHTAQSGSMHDIELFVAARFPPLDDDALRRQFITDITARSNGIFLWASLTIARLETAYSLEDMQDVVEEMPSEMDAFYSRIITSIAAGPSCDLVRCVLTWIVCAEMPLTIAELTDAVKRDIGRTMTASTSQLQALTGHLIVVDEQSRIHIAHETTSSFLTRKGDGFWIDRDAAHTRMAEICLEILCGQDFLPPRTRHARMSRCQTTSLLADYAAHTFAYHLLHSSVARDAPQELLCKFLRSNILTWIETIASEGLVPLQRTVQRLQAYTRRRENELLRRTPKIQTVIGWVTDLGRVAAVFHQCLLASPSSIHYLVPLLCPARSAIRQQFGKPTKRLRITGCQDQDWSDRLTSYPFSVEANSLACSGHLLAVGLRSGEIALYNSGNFAMHNYIRTLGQGKRVRQLAFNRSSSLLVSCSVQSIILWSVARPKDTDFSCVWSRELDFIAYSVSFSTDEKTITVTNPDGCALVNLNVSDGSTGGHILLHAMLDSDSSDGSDEQLGCSSWTPAKRVRLDPGHTRAAMSYRNSYVELWDLDETRMIGGFMPEGSGDAYSSPETLDMVFNPAPDIGLLAISYNNGELVTVNADTLEQQDAYQLQYSLDVLAASSNGRVLAGGCQDGTVHLFCFQSLRPFYRIPPPEEQGFISNITFSADNHRLFDTRGQYCNVWKPVALIQEEIPDGDLSNLCHSHEAPISEPVAAQAHVLCWGGSITVLQQTSDCKYVFTGHQDGRVQVWELSTGDSIAKLSLHGSFCEILHMDWNENKKFLLTADTTGRCLVTHITCGSEGENPQTKNVLDHRESSSIHQALLSPDAASLLIQTDSATKLIDMQGNAIAEHQSSSEVSYIHHPANGTWLIALQSSLLRLLDWTSLEMLVSPETIPATLVNDPTENNHFSWAGRLNSSYLASATTSDDRITHISAIRLIDLNPNTTYIPMQSRHVPSLAIKSLLGVLRSSLYFLDTTGWVCSISLKNLVEATHYTRHFFIPPTWFSGGTVVARIVSKTAVVFARVEQLVVFHGFLEFEEAVAIGHC